MLKNDDDYATSDEDGDNDPSLLNQTTRRSTEGGEKNTGDSGTTLHASSIMGRHELATRTASDNFSSSYMIANENVEAPIPTSTLPVETSTLNALVNKQTTSRTSMSNKNDKSSEMRSTKPASSHSGVPDDIVKDQSGEPIENESPNKQDTAVNNPPTSSTTIQQEAAGLPKETSEPVARRQPSSPESSPPLVPSLPPLLPAELFPLPQENTGDLPRIVNPRIERSTDDNGKVHLDIAYETFEPEGHFIHFFSANDFKLTHAGRNLVYIEKSPMADFTRMSGFVLKIIDIGYDPNVISTLAVDPAIDNELFESGESSNDETSSTRSSTCDSILSKIRGKWIIEDDSIDDELIRPSKLSFNNFDSDGQLWDIVWNPKVRDYIHIPRSNIADQKKCISWPSNIPTSNGQDIKSGAMNTPRNSPATVPTEIELKPRFDFSDLFEGKFGVLNSKDDSDSMEATEENSLGKRKREFYDDPGEWEPDEKYRRVGGDEFSLQPESQSERLRKINEMMDEMAVDMGLIDQMTEPMPLIEAIAASADVNMVNVDQNLSSGGVDDAVDLESSTSQN